MVLKTFLDIALRDELLPMIEIKQRRKENRLTLIKIFLKQGRKFEEVIIIYR